MISKTPCQKSPTPDDWYIERDGKQYRDDDLIDPAVRERIELEHVTEPPEVLEKALEREEAEQVRLALIQRRKAKDSCYECPLRLECLDIRLSQMPDSAGTWGGYYPEQLRQIEKLRRDRGIH